MNDQTGPSSALHAPDAPDAPDQFTEMEWIKFLDIEPLSAGQGQAVIRLNPRSVHLNHNGTVNAPVLFALAEIAGAGALVAGMLEEAAQSYTVVRRANIEYLAPARGSVTATGYLPPDRFDASLAAVRAQRPIELDVPVVVSDGAGTEVCTATLTVAIRPRRQEPQERQPR